MRWIRIPIMYDYAVQPLRVTRSRGRCTASGRSGSTNCCVSSRPQLEPLKLTKYRGKIVEATRTASRLNPTNAELHARLAHASAEISMYQRCRERGE